MGLAAERAGKFARMVDHDKDDSDPEGIFGSTWVLVAARRELFETPSLKKVAAELQGNRRLRLWTDDYSNLFWILK